MSESEPKRKRSGSPCRPVRRLPTPRLLGEEGNGSHQSAGPPDPGWVHRFQEGFRSSGQAAGDHPATDRAREARWARRRAPARARASGPPRRAYASGSGPRCPCLRPGPSCPSRSRRKHRPLPPVLRPPRLRCRRHRLPLQRLPPHRPGDDDHAVRTAPDGVHTCRPACPAGIAPDGSRAACTACTACPPAPVPVAVTPPAPPALRPMAVTPPAPRLPRQHRLRWQPSRPARLRQLRWQPCRRSRYRLLPARWRFLRLCRSWRNPKRRRPRHPCR